MITCWKFLLMIHTKCQFLNIQLILQSKQCGLLRQFSKLELVPRVTRDLSFRELKPV